MIQTVLYVLGIVLLVAAAALAVAAVVYFFRFDIRAVWTDVCSSARPAQSRGSDTGAMPKFRRGHSALSGRAKEGVVLSGSQKNPDAGVSSGRSGENRTRSEQVDIPTVVEAFDSMAPEGFRVVRRVDAMQSPEIIGRSGCLVELPIGLNEFVGRG